MDEVTVEGILHALSDPTRAQIYMNLAAAECPKNCSTFLEMKKKPLPKSTLSQHFRVLREAGLVRSERQGVELINTTRCAELGERFGSLVSAILENYQKQFKVKKR